MSNRKQPDWLQSRVEACMGTDEQPACEHAGPSFLCRFSGRVVEITKPEEYCEAGRWGRESANPVPRKQPSPRKPATPPSRVRRWLGGTLQLLLVALRHRSVGSMVLASRRAGCFGDSSNAACPHLRKRLGFAICDKCGCLASAKIRAAWQHCPVRRWRAIPLPDSAVLCAMRCFGLIGRCSGGCGGA